MQLTIPYQCLSISVKVDHYQPEVKPLPFGPHDHLNADPGSAMELDYTILAIDGEKPEADDIEYFTDDLDFEQAIVEKYTEFDLAI